MKKLSTDYSEINGSQVSLAQSLTINVFQKPIQKWKNVILSPKMSDDFAQRKSHPAQGSVKFFEYNVYYSITLWAQKNSYILAPVFLI